MRPDRPSNLNLDPQTIRFAYHHVLKEELKEERRRAREEKQRLAAAHLPPTPVTALPRAE